MFNSIIIKCIGEQEGRRGWFLMSFSSVCMCEGQSHHLKKNTSQYINGERKGKCRESSLIDTSAVPSAWNTPTLTHTLFILHTHTHFFSSHTHTYWCKRQKQEKKVVFRNGEGRDICPSNCTTSLSDTFSQSLTTKAFTELSDGTRALSVAYFILLLCPPSFPPLNGIFNF